MTQHTPGPWTVHTNFATATYTVFDEDGNYGETDGDTLTANAALIAAAPELLEALQSLAKSFVTWGGDGGDDDDDDERGDITISTSQIAAARAAIARATGGAQ